MRIKAIDLCRNIRAQGFRPRSYSGRGMYGAECVGVSLDSPGDLDSEGLPRATQDSLGRGVILYWPGAKWTAECETRYPEES